MGIKSNFNKFLKETCPEVFEEIHLSEYAYKRIAVDISLYLHKFKAVSGDNWLNSFINLITCFRRNKIHCVFIFDGKSPKEKQKEQSRRREEKAKMENQLIELEEAYKKYEETGVINKCLIDLFNRKKSPSPKRFLSENHKEKINMEWVKSKIKQKRNQLYNICPCDFKNAKHLFDILNVPYYDAPWEAEKTCSKLCLDGKVESVLSEDTDVMAYCSPVFLTRIDTYRDTCVRIKHSDLLESLNLSKEQFVDLCIMCGTDYNKNIYRVGSKSAYKYITKYKTIEDISLNTNLDVSVLNYKRVRELLTDFEKYYISDIPYCGYPDFDKLKTFINTFNIGLNINKLIDDFNNKTLIINN